MILILSQKSNFDPALTLSSTDEGDGPAELTVSVAATSVISVLQELSHRSRSTAVLRCEEVCARIDIAKIKRSEKMKKMIRYMGGRMETMDFTHCKVKKMKSVKFEKEKRYYKSLQNNE